MGKTKLKNPKLKFELSEIKGNPIVINLTGDSTQIINKRIQTIKQVMSKAITNIWQNSNEKLGALIGYWQELELETEQDIKIENYNTYSTYCLTVRYNESIQYCARPALNINNGKINLIFVDQSGIDEIVYSAYLDEISEEEIKQYITELFTNGIALEIEEYEKSKKN